MSLLPASLELDRAITQQNVALSALKQTANAQAQIANVIANAATSISASNRGAIVNISV